MSILLFLIGGLIVGSFFSYYINLSVSEVNERNLPAKTAAIIIAFCGILALLLRAIFFHPTVFIFLILSVAIAICLSSNASRFTGMAWMSLTVGLGLGLIMSIANVWDHSPDIYHPNFKLLWLLLFLAAPPLALLSPSRTEQEEEA